MGVDGPDAAEGCGEVRVSSVEVDCYMSKTLVEDIQCKRAHSMAIFQGSLLVLEGVRHWEGRIPVDQVLDGCSLE